jgi:hypothetical protein
MKLRAWITPLTIGSFLLIGFTGLLMFFKVRSGLIVVAHEWLSLTFLVGACLHTWLNWGAVRAHLSRPRGLIIVGLFAALLILSVLPFGEVLDGHGHGQEIVARRATEILLQARIATFAEITQRTPEQVRDSLGRHGIRVVSDTVTLADAARESRTHPMRVLAAALE